jgi:hypothetical protein
MGELTKGFTNKHLKYKDGDIFREEHIMTCGHTVHFFCIISSPLDPNILRECSLTSSIYMISLM